MQVSTKILQTIESLGLSAHESKAYVALLQMGKGSADSVASRAGLKRATAYLALESLLHVGLATKIPRARKMIFVAKDPKEIVNIATERLSATESILPALRSMTESAGSFNTVLFEGVKGIKNALRYKMDGLKNTSYVGFFGHTDHTNDELVSYIHRWNLQNAKNNITSRAIVPEHPSLKEFRKNDDAHAREVKKVSLSDYPSETSIEVFEDFIRVIMFKQEAAVVIQSKPLSTMLRSIFEMLWKALPEE